MPRMGILVLILTQSFLAFSHEYDVSCRPVIYVAFIMLRFVPYTCFVESFYYKEILNFFKCFFIRFLSFIC